MSGWSLRDGGVLARSCGPAMLDAVRRRGAGRACKQQGKYRRRLDPGNSIGGIRRCQEGQVDP